MKPSDFLRCFLAMTQLGIWQKLDWQRTKSNSIFLNVPRHGLHRYILCLHNQLNPPNRQQQTQLILSLSKYILVELHKGRNWKPYENALLQLPTVKFSLTKNKNQTCTIDYFSPRRSSLGHYRIPIGPHPYFNYQNRIATVRSKTIFWAGNQSAEYQSTFDTDLWRMPSRHETTRFLYKNHPSIIPKKLLSREEFEQALQSHRFYICLPGMYMPECHNFYEAAILGCIPVCHVKYLQWTPIEYHDILKPYSWSSHQELSQLITNLESAVTATDEISSELVKICCDILGPERIAEKIRNAHTLHLCAEEKSVHLHKTRVSNDTWDNYSNRK